MILPEPPQLVEFLEPYPEATQRLSRGLRNKLVLLLPPCIETVWDAVNTVGPSYGFTEKNSDHFIHLATYTKYVNIGFAKGAILDDPENRLQGNGARIRQFKLTKIEDIDDPYIQNLINQAVFTANQSDQNVKAKTIIRVMNGPKRRPSKK